MKNRFQLTKARRKQGGYALLLVVFLTALVLVGTMTIGLRILTEGRREKEQEMIWRGKQYTRGIKLYYRKLGRFPNSMDDLVKPKIGNLRFMRQAYKDPMNKEDGAWRLIYVGPAGQLIGSLNPAVNSVQMPASAGQPGAPGNASSTIGGIAGQSGASGGFAPGSTAPSTPANGQVSPGSAPGTGAQGTDTGAGTDSQAVPTGDTPTIVGGSIIGVGSKVNQRSVMVFEKAHNYRLFEFIWDPSKDLGTVSSPGAPIGTPAGAPGQNPTAPQPNNPLNPPPGPPTSTPNPNPSQQ
ncbi:MAG TPA: hypothetical protein VIX91_19905 [Candidatus Acidoferrum sp.]